MNFKGLLMNAAMSVLFVMLLSVIRVDAQVTTSMITGQVVDKSGETLPGATVKALHEPTGTVYSTITTSTGQYNLPNMRVGGPYKLDVTFIGMLPKTITGITLALGSPININIVLEDETQNLAEVTVTAEKGSVISSSRTGTSTFISNRTLSSIPTVSRSISDLTRLTPQASTTSSGTSFGGQNNRYNQFTIDGANANDGFGLSSSGNNGGQANVNPISLETIQEMQIVMSPYDVTQGGFTGGGINAVTKSGSNQFHGSVYGQYQNEGFVGKSPKYNDNVTRNKYADFSNRTIGASVSGPLIKNKLFFYANVENYLKSTPLAFDPTKPGSGSFVNPDVLSDLRQFMISEYNYDPGTYGALNNENKSTSMFARIDWNINAKHSLTVRHNLVDGSDDKLSRSPTSAVFSNGGYAFMTKSNSTVVELNSNLSTSTSNVFRVTYNRIRDSRSTARFPSLFINNKDGLNGSTISYALGSDNSSHVNSLDQDYITLTDNFTMYKGKHTLTFGTHNEIFFSKNAFLQNFYGNYTYGLSNNTNTDNIDNFKNNLGTGLTNYSVGYATSGDLGDKAAAKLGAGQFSLYAQDVWAAAPNFKLTYGVRVDMPVYFDKPATNPLFNESEIAKQYSVATNVMPKAQLMFSPRVGFNWDVNNDAVTQIRGGAGLFTGRIPFVWISNQLSNTGMTQISYSAGSQAVRNDISFNYDPSLANVGAWIPENATQAATTINVIDRNFKYPQVFRGNLAIERKLPVWGLVGSLEGMFTKTLNNANYQNLNLSETGESKVTIADTERPLWTEFQNDAFNQVILLKNTNKGDSYNVTAQLTKPYSQGWSGFVAYTYGNARSLTDLTSSVAYSNWRYAYAVNGLNHLTLSRSNFSMGSRVVGSVTKEFKYGKNFGTNITLIYTGQSGAPATYLYSRTITGDDRPSNSAQNTIAYLPANMSQANFVDINRGATASEQWAHYQEFMNANTYLKEEGGRNAERNGFRLPWENHFDLRIAQDFKFGVNKLQVFFDILNVGALLNSNWGRSYTLSNQSATLFTVQNSGTQTQDGVAKAVSAQNPAFQFNINNFTEIDGERRPYNVSDWGSRWNAQIGVRYSF